MGRMLIALAVTIACLANFSGARAEEIGRFTMTPTDDGFLRLDTKSGAVSLCLKKADGWACRSIADDRQALQREIDRLTQENLKLSKTIDELKRGRLSGPVGPEGPDGLKRKFNFPSEEEVDKAMKFAEGLLRRFKDMMDNLQPRPKPESERQL